MALPTTVNLARLALAVWAITLAVIACRVALTPGRHTVYPIFADAGRNWSAGGDLYAPPRPGLDQFRYSPAVAAFFAPWALLPAGVGEGLWRALNAAVFLAGLAAWCRSAPGGLAWPFALAAVWLPALGSLNNGQANLLVGGLMMLAVAAFGHGRMWSAALAVVVAALFKGYPLALGLLFCVAEPRRFGWRLAATAAAGLAVPFLLQSPTWVAGQYGDWWHRLHCDDRSAFPVVGGYQDARTLLRVLGVTMPGAAWSAVQALAGLACAAMVWARRGDAAWTAGTLGLAWMTLFGPATETCTWVLLSPAAAWAAWSARGVWARAAVWMACGVLLAVVLAIGFPWLGKPMLAYAPQPAAGVVLTAWLAARLFRVESARARWYIEGSSTPASQAHRPCS